jgi:hypothetical protein
MTREREIEILIKDRCTRAEAEKLLKNGSTVYEDLEENLEKYLDEWKYLDEEDNNFTDSVEKMVETKQPMVDWGIVNDNGKTYYIEYVL